MEDVKFAHIADCHLGAWRDQKMRALSEQCFSDAIDITLAEKVDFVILAGDLFNTAIPNIDSLKLAAEKLKLLADANIPVYGVAGSHDYSATGKSMLEVLEKAKLFTNVMKGDVIDNKLLLHWVTDKKTGIKITGILGKRNTLESKYYDQLDRDSILNESGSKIFVFHSGIKELFPEMSETPLSFLPKGCSYYAGGHIHSRCSEIISGYGQITYPGPIFPNSFSELETLQAGSFVIVKNLVPRFVELKPKKIHVLEIHAKHTPAKDIESQISSLDGIADHIILLRITGITEGQIDFAQVYEQLYEKGAYHILRNTSGLNVPEVVLTDKKVTDIDNVEKEVINEHVAQSFLTTIDGKEVLLEKQKQKIHDLLHTLATEKLDGETTTDFEDRIFKEYIHNDFS